MEARERRSRRIGSKAQNEDVLWTVELVPTLVVLSVGLVGPTIVSSGGAVAYVGPIFGDLLGDLSGDASAEGALRPHMESRGNL